MIWPLILFLGALGILGVALSLRARTGAKKPPAADADLLAESDEEEFEASVRRKQQERALLDANPPQSPRKRGEDGSLPDAQSEILWNESDDVYRPVSEDVRRFARSLGLGESLTFKRKQPLTFLRRPAYEQVQAHLRSNLTIELGGLLLGRAFHDPTLDTYFVLIEEALPADGGAGTAISFEYTSSTWTHLTPQLQQMNPDWTVLGSYHSHPGLGVFLSTTDRDTQESVFSQDWQVALVIDPIADEIGFFFGEKGKPSSEWHLIENL